MQPKVPTCRCHLCGHIVGFRYAIIATHIHYAHHITPHHITPRHITSHPATPHSAHYPNGVPSNTRLAAVAGGLVGQAPNALLTERIGWRAVEWCLFGLQVVISIMLVVLWIIECSHNNKRPNRRQNQNQPESGTEDHNPSHRAVAKAPSASVERGVATAYRKPGHVKVTTQPPRS